jgi:hypothetical protein
MILKMEAVNYAETPETLYGPYGAAFSKDTSSSSI